MFSKYDKNFWRLSWAMFLFMTSFNLILPELNQFFSAIGGDNQKGLIITLFTISAGLTRPFSGKLSDTIGRKKVMILGISICFVAALLYPLSYSIPLFLLLRFFHGFSAGFLPTGATALVTDILPADKRGEGMGIWGTFSSLGIGVGQSLGSLINDTFGINSLFMISAMFAVFSGILILNVNETLKHKQKFRPELLAIKWADVFEKNVLPSALVMFLTASCSGIIFVITPDMSEFLGIQNKGWFFGIYVVSTIFVRLFTGSMSDKIGRRETLIFGFILLIISMLLIGYSTNATMYTFSAIFFGLATGVSSPTLFAWTADLSHPERRGIGTGTLFIAMETGIMLGSFSTMFIYNNNLKTIPLAFWFGTILTILATIYLIWHIRYRQSNT